MNIASLTAQPLGLAAAQAQVDNLLRDFLDAKATTAKADGLPEDIAHALREFLDAGGKRLRPVLCVIGWHAAGGHGDTGPVVGTAAALEMFHAFCLIHDDIMDHSVSRRGRPTVHHALAARHPDRPGRGHDTTWLGTSGAILVGDMALAWSDELLDAAALPSSRLAEVRRVIHAMREEVIHGQYLDLLAPLGAATDLNTALTVIRYKTAKYTIERPLHTGAVLAGAGRPLRAALSRFALPLGEAFQLRDDLLGVFGNPHQTGKPVLDDLREGKHTALLALAHQRATPAQQALLAQLVGDSALDEDGAARIRQVLEAAGARAAVESMITTRYGQALAALESVPITPPATMTLRRIAALAVERAA